MSKDGDPTYSGGWQGRVIFTGGAEGTAYRPDEFIVIGQDGYERALGLLSGLTVEPFDPTDEMTVRGPISAKVFRIRMASGSGTRSTSGRSPVAI